MSLSRKYGRTYHYDFSPGTTSDDRINYEWYEDMLLLDEVVITEKLDGENTCISPLGIFARSHAAPTLHPWSEFLKPIQAMIKNDLDSLDLEIFGENLYATHSIEYTKLESHFFVFGVRQKDKWLSWEEVEWYANFFDFKTVPILGKIKTREISKDNHKNLILDIVSKESTFGSIDSRTKQICTMEGVVVKNTSAFEISDNGSINKKHVFKWVRKGHVNTDQHWSRNWKRASLIWEK